MIKIQNLTKSLGDKLLIDDLSLEFQKGVVGVITSSKQEKAALLNILSANDTSFSGNVYYSSLDLQENARVLKKKIGYLLAGAPVYEDMTAQEFLTFIGQAKGVNLERLYNQIEEALELVDLLGKGNVLIGNLSKKERKLLSIAQALIGNPSVIILDEPLTFLDLEGFRTVTAIIKMLSEIKPVFIFGVSNSHLAEVCNSLLVISDGAPSFHDDIAAIKELLCKPAEEESKESENSEEDEESEEENNNNDDNNDNDEEDEI